MGTTLNAYSSTIAQNAAAVDIRVPGTEPAHARKPVLAILADHPVQHFSPLYKELARNRSIDTIVVFANLKGAEAYFDEGLKKEISWGSGILDAFPYVNLAMPGSASLGSLWKGLGAVLKEVRPDVLFVYGYSVPISRAGILWGRFHGTSIVMTCDSELLRPRSFLNRAAKAVIVPCILGQFDRLFTVGDANENYFLRYGASRTKFVRASFPIDSEQLDEVRNRRAEIRSQVRAELNVSKSAFLLLSAGKLTLEKGFRDLVLAFKKLIGRRPESDAYLLIAGSGAERDRLEHLVAQTDSRVRLLGFVPPIELFRLYTASDLYVHPSHVDAHPLAISEAIYCGLPVVASDRVGSVGPTDDVVQGVNGWSYPCGDVEALARVLSDILENPRKLETAGKASFAAGAKHRPEAVASIVMETVVSLAAEGRDN